MRVLHVIPYTPVPPRFGGALRIYHMIKALRRYHDVTIVAIGNPEDRMLMHEHFDVPLDQIHIVAAPWTRRYRRIAQSYSMFTNHTFAYHALNATGIEARINSILASQTFDVVQTECTMFWASRGDIDAIKIINAQNVEYEIFQRMALQTRSPIRKWYYNKQARMTFREELGIIRRQDALFVTSERDADLFDADIPHIPKFVVPNGVDASYFYPSQAAPEPYSLVFVGMMGYVPNYDGMLYFLDEIWPTVKREVPGVKIYIVGQRPPKELQQRASDQVVITGFVDDVRPYIDRASVYVVPLRSGGGTRLKILEAMAMKKPIVTTSIGCEGIDITHEESALIADDPGIFARHVIDLLHDEEMCRRFSKTGYDLVHARYDWSVVGKQMEAAYQTLVPSTQNHNILVG